MAFACASTLPAQDSPQKKTDPDASSAVELSGVDVHSTRIAAVKGAAADGYRVDTVSAGPLGETSEKEIPYAIATAPASLIENTMATNTTDAVKYIPTIQSNTGASQITPYFTIRGFSASTWSYNMALDGMRSFDIYQPLEDKERIEILSGTNSLLFGITNPAGMVNYVLKRPVDKPMANVSIDSYDQQFYTHLDAGGPVRHVGNSKLNYRLNLLYGNAGDAGIEHQSQERFLASGALDWHVRSHTTLSLESSWSKRNLRYAQALFMPSTTTGIPAAPDANKNFGAPYTGAWDSTTRVGLGVHSRLGDAFSLRSNFRFTDIKRQYFLNRQVWQNKALDYKWRVDSQAPFDTYVTQYGLYLDAKAKTGPLHHLFTFGGGIDYFDSRNNGYRGTTYATVYSSNLYGTPSYAPYSLPPVGASTSETTVYENAIAVDRMEIGAHWAVFAGGALARVNDSLTSITAANVSTVSKYDNYAFTPNVALSYKPVGRMTTYYSFGQGLQQGAVVPAGAVNAGQVFAPFVSNQNEIGIKTDLARLIVNTALFRIEQANQYSVASGGATTYYQDGKQTNQGVEFTFSGKLIESLSLNGGFTLTDATVNKTSSTTLQGKAPQGVSSQTNRLYAEYALPGLRGLVVTGGASFNGRAWVDAANTLSIPSAVPVDAGLRLDTTWFGHSTSLRLEVGNLTARNYWTTRSAILYPGSARLVSGSVTIARF